VFGKHRFLTDALQLGCAQPIPGWRPLNPDFRILTTDHLPKATHYKLSAAHNCGDDRQAAAAQAVYSALWHVPDLIYTPEGRAETVNILVLNAGSSSQKCSLYRVEGALPNGAPTPLWEAHQDGSRLTVSAGEATVRRTLTTTDAENILPTLLETLWNGPTAVLSGPDEIDVVGHRVVHGARAYSRSTLISPAVKTVIAQLSSLAPAHNPPALAGIAVAGRVLGETPQVAVFDTAFHSTIPDAAAVYPGPYVWVEEGVRRYGFHGISHAYSAGRAAQLLGRDPASLRLITCHLGNGCSLCAVKGGRSVDTTMGFTPLEGLMMGTRSGSIDPGLLLYLLREEGYTPDALSDLLNRESGLKGISGVSGDLREVLAAVAAGNPRAQLAFDIYVHRIRFYLGAMLAGLGGLEALVFTGGVGEHSEAVRAAVCDAFGFLGVHLDDDKNNAKSGAPVDRDIAAEGAPVRVLVVHTEENWAIAGECWKVKQE